MNTTCINCVFSAWFGSRDKKWHCTIDGEVIHPLQNSCDAVLTLEEALEDKEVTIEQLMEAKIT